MDPMLTLMQIAALTVAGMCHAMLGSVKVPLAKNLQIDEARVGGLVSVFGFTLIPMVFAAGLLVDEVGRQAVLGGGFVLLIVSLVMLSRSRDYLTALFAILILGTGWSALVNVLNVTSPPAFVPLEETNEHIAFAMNLGDFIFGMGAFVTPVLVAMLIPRIGFGRVFLVLAAVAAVPLLLGFGVDWERIAQPVSDSVSGGLAKLLSNPVVWLCCLAFFCHVPIEASTATWATTLMNDQGVNEKSAATFLSVFWLAFMGSRLAAALGMLLLDAPGREPLIVVVMAALCIGFTLGFVFSRSVRMTCTMVVAAGIILGPIFPTLIAILLREVPDELDGRAVGLFFCIGGIGWTTVPILIGQYARRTNVQRAFLIATTCATFLAALTTALAIILPAT